MTGNTERLIDLYRSKPDAFFEDVLGVDTLEDYQRNVIRKIAEHDRVLVRSSHSTGKTWLMGRIALWFYSCFDNSLVITTAPTWKQVENLLWGEIREAFKNSKMPLGGTLLNTKLTKSDKWFCLGLSPKVSATVDTDEQQGSSFQGYHSKHIMVIFDEATGIAPDVWKMVEGLLTSGAVVKFVAIANPTTRACEFYKRFSLPTFYKLHLSCFDSPNLKANGFHCVEDIESELESLMLMAEDDRLRRIDEYLKPVPHLASAQWAISYCMEWGLTHPLVLSKAFGEFPDEDESVLIPMSVVESAMELNIQREIEAPKLRTVGVDVARYGSDKSVIVDMVDGAMVGVRAIKKRSINEVTGNVLNVLRAQHEGIKTNVLVDATGVGAGVYDNLVELQREGKLTNNISLIEINFGASPVNPNELDEDKKEKDKNRFFNLKSKMFQLLANDLKDGNIGLVNDSNFLKELPTIKTFVDTKGRLRVESKDDYRKRTGRSSPDFADALALCNYGRYVTIETGSFRKLQRAALKPKVKKGFKPRKSRIKITNY